MYKNKLILILTVLLFYRCTSPKYDIVIKNGHLYDGTGQPAQQVDIGIKNDTIAFIGKIEEKGALVIDADGLCVAPGFINALSWASKSLLLDGKSMSNLLQGVTLEVFGEGRSDGPLNEEMKKELKEGLEHFSYENQWSSFGEFLDFLTQKGVSCNVASFVGAATVRKYVMGYQNREAKPKEIEKMQELVRQAMEEGALGLGSSLVYAPGSYASTKELIALCKVVSGYGGIYISHMRNEADEIEIALQELIEIAEKANIPAEIYHIKLSGEKNWGKANTIIQMIEEARERGLKITTNMYNYIASSTGLDINVPTWAQEGSFQEWIEELKNDENKREKVLKEMKKTLENYRKPDKIMIVGVFEDTLKQYIGEYVNTIAKKWNLSAEETILQLLEKNKKDIQAVYFLMNDSVQQKFMQLPFTSFGSDARSISNEGVFIQNSTHPRTYGNFARLLGKYVREEKILSLQEAIYRLTGLTAEKFNIKKRGQIKAGYFADIVIFDPHTIIDKATFETPHLYAEGMKHVLVNGVWVIKNGEHTGKFPGRVVKGAGWNMKK